MLFLLRRAIILCESIPEEGALINFLVTWVIKVKQNSKMGDIFDPSKERMTSGDTDEWREAGG